MATAHFESRAAAALMLMSRNENHMPSAFFNCGARASQATR
jgi:hypothetical protein